ncbi:MarR family transcriptional regulator [Actinotalea sp.]|uniref:MarR family winged helix-turn-helix transcriptional regulator n=1 Tax=Actinotalea sp. TaxID=1872145 RepID=UPI002D056EAD|nr:MarR family transcriptional regulator [Actinotalea sp.]HQY32776.1 MarR family transcriptional regulator [Actinotalea sp.]HRA50404.1 MarR family transcriptional regulator [Actinotalea sp.]
MSTTAQAPADVPADTRDRPGARPADEVRWLDEDQQRAWRSFLLGSARLTEALGRQLEADSDLSLSEYEILVRLSEAPEHTARMSELAQSLMHSRSRITHTVGRLERRGLVERHTCLADGRGVNARMTAAGYRLLVAAAPGHVRAVRAHLVDLLTADQLRGLGDAMALVAPLDPPAPPAG